MEEIKSANISVNLNNGNISITGTEAFIEKNMEAVFSFVEKNIRSVPKAVEESRASIEASNLTCASSDIPESQRIDVECDKYIKQGVYHIDAEDGGISILKKIPGKSKAEKMKNIALIVLYIRKGKIEGKELVPICEKHACFDSAHFSSVFKNEKTNIVRKGSGQNWTIELTQPGEAAAVELLEGMANDKK